MGTKFGVAWWEELVNPEGHAPSEWEPRFSSALNVIPTISMQSRPQPTILPHFAKFYDQIEFLRVRFPLDTSRRLDLFNCKCVFNPV